VNALGRHRAAPLPKLQGVQTADGLELSLGVPRRGGDFNYDFNVSITEEQQRNGGSEYNYRRGGHADDRDDASAPS